ncbi:hypothetical protein [Absidia glauca]|uniref:PSP proline-rich domain-containing protein n=1 Tax=Absidia glauca TaxID=4829 RepID=A0A168L353_ABSGL|nr:hypothetical protein [Absidia glauca]
MVAQVANTILKDTNNAKKTQEPRKRNRKKTKKQKADEASRQQARTHQTRLEPQQDDNDLKDVEIEYIVKPMDVSSLKTMDGMANLEDDMLNQFSDIFRHFQTGKEEDDEDAEVVHSEEGGAQDSKPTDEHDQDNDSDTDAKDQVISKKKLKQLTRPSVAELKQMVSKPEAVEWWDVNAEDPKLLVQLKSYRNTVPVPVHWSQKRKYLQNKRGIEKPPFELPEFIKDTGIMEMRDAVKEKEDAAGLKSKMREKVAPRMGKLDVDYQKYYEGKENETKVQEKNPGQLSEELKQALNMPPLAPPPWLINMQRYGPPPSYPTLKIAGLNAPIPEGAQWGYHPGGWGRPPVDEFNRPIYGDVFGVTEEHAQPQMPIEPVDRTLFGELESDEEIEESESEEEEEEEEEEQAEEKQEEDETLKDGLVTPSGIASVSTVASGLETPDVIELRKEGGRRHEEPSNKQLYQVLPQVDKNVSGLMGSQHGYDLQNVDKPVIAPTSGRLKRKLEDNVDVAIDPSELENGGLDESTLRAKYDETMKSKLPSTANGEDLSDMYAEHASRQAAKKKKSAQEGKGKQKEREFKF